MKEENVISTKQKILETAITLFAEKGYSDVSIREITRAVGIKESSLYNHFASKQQILDEIFDYLAREFEKVSIPEDQVVRMIEKMSPEEFLEFSAKAFQSYMGNPVMMKIWRILSMERFKNDKANEFFRENLIDSAIRYQSLVFQTMMEKGLIRKLDPVLLAREFYSYMLYIYFRYFEMEKAENSAESREIQQMVREHMQFISMAISVEEEKSSR